MNSVALQATRQAKHSRMVHRSVGVDSVLLGVFICLMCLGLIMVFSSSIAMGDRDLHVNTNHFMHQAVYMSLGVFITIVVANISLGFWQRISIPLLVITVLSLTLLLFIGAEVNGSKRWISLLGFRLQPAEIAKLVMVIYAASYLERKREQIHKIKGIFFIALVLAVIGLLLLLQPDFGSFFVIISVVGLMLFLGGIRVLHTIICLGLAVTAMGFLVVMEEYRVQRLLSFRDPFADPYSSGYQLSHALIAIGRGEIFGVGIGASIEKLYYLPHAHNDFILAVIGEELGLVGIFMVIILFGLLLHRALYIARTAELVGRVFASRLAQGIGFLFVFQTVINIGVNLGVLPTKGLTLPFISYGGSSMLVCCAAMGLLFAIDRQNRRREAQYV